MEKTHMFGAKIFYLINILKFTKNVRSEFFRRNW